MSGRSPCFQFLAATMSSRLPVQSHRGGRSHRRGFSDRPFNGANGRFVSGDSHISSVSNSNRGVRQGNYTAVPPAPFYQNQPFRQPPPYNQNQQFRPPPLYNRNPQFRRPRPPFDQNQAVQSRPRPRPPKPLDYRNWEHSKASLPPYSERFVVLSYNILADYLALSHRSKLYFHIPRHLLDWEWRKRSILFELGLWSADIMCFQEVDRFQDLEVELKFRGYTGIWKMRTGNAIDGCAIFWRASRFKLLYEEGIEFNKLGLRDNVAQICVLELLSQNFTENSAALPTSSAHSKKVAICNIHVLFNPKRGEIKLGQVRTLLEKAHAVSKTWNDAPVVLCGDFNCTPKSPLYNFILEQKLDLSGVDRDKVSGQASAEIREPPPPHSRVQSDGSTQGPPEAGISVSDPPSDNLEHDKDGNAEILNSTNSSSRSQCTDTVLGVSDKASSHMHCANKDSATSDEVTKESRQTMIDDSEVAVSGNGDKASNEHSDSNENTESVNHSTASLGNDCPSSVYQKKGSSSTLHQVEASSTATSIDFVLADKLENLSLGNLDETKAESESIREDGNAFLFALHSTEDSSQSNFDHYAQSNLDPNSEELGDELIDDLSPGLDSEAVNAEETTYNPSLWTPMEIATATGNADCTYLEHPLQLRSTYAEVEDCTGTRDSQGEPLVTSYNRRFKGTVDYILRSEGLQTVRVLAPIPKHAMQWTPGYPTKKWGSDHIALASEVAFVETIK